MLQQFMSQYMPVYDEISSPLRHICVHSSLKIEREHSAVDYSSLTGAIIKSVSAYYPFNDSEPRIRPRR